MIGLTNVESDKVVCQEYPSYPLFALGATGALIKNLPLICGGHREKPVKGRIDHCYTLTQDSAKLTARLSIARSNPKSIVINDEKLFLTGGYNESKGYTRYLSITEFVTPGKPTELGPKLPYTVYLHCFLKINESIAMVVAGKGGFDGRKTLFYDISKNMFSNGPSLSVARNFLSCGRLDVDGTYYIVAIGGSGKKTVELWSSAKADLWTKGPDFPSLKATCCGETINGRDGNWLLYLPGGSRDVYKFTLDLEGDQFKWSITEEKRLVARSKFVVIGLPPDKVTCSVDIQQKNNNTVF